MTRRIQGIIFSKDRALQLDATIASFFLHCRDAKLVELAVVFKASNAEHAAQYQKLSALYPSVSFQPEQDFRTHVLSLLANPYVLFLVDDNIFVQDFRIGEVLEALEARPEALGFSLRLGTNTTYCYALNRPQALPAFQTFNLSSGKKILCYSWSDAQADFAYPLEVSSSVYRTRELAPLLSDSAFTHPNSLEGHMAQHAILYKSVRPLHLCFETSVTFCNPINKVQSVAPENRAGSQVEYQADELSRCFSLGDRINVAAFTGFIPNACHQEAPLQLRSVTLAPRPTSNAPRIEHVNQLDTKALIAVIIPCYKQAHLLQDAVASVVAQTYTTWECVIVNDGSPDNTSEVARQLIRKYPNHRIRLLEKENEGLAEARNTGIRETTGDWILPLDSDDMFAPTFMEKTLGVALREPGVNIVSTHVQEFGARSNLLEVFPFVQATLLQGNMFPYASLYRRELWKNVGGYIPVIPFGAEDYNFWVTCSPVLNPRRVTEPLFLYRKHANASMVDAVISHQHEVDACLRTCHPSLYSPEQLMKEHEVLAFMKEDTLAVVERNISKFPQFSQPHLWRGLTLEAAGRWRQSLREFLAAAKLASPEDWQPFFRLALLGAEKGEYRLACECAAETLKRCKDFPARRQLEQLIAMKA